jgi:ATPase subunit of ABC transporter with duplicated ATPase domains
LVSLPDPQALSRLKNREQKRNCNSPHGSAAGISKNRSHQPCLLDGGIYNSLVAQCPFHDGPKHPQLVSFIGQTNAGKSTLIKMLIDHAETQPNLASYASPVVGSSIHSRSPTSADVHLYADPRTYPTSRPQFYADVRG